MQTVTHTTVRDLSKFSIEFVQSLQQYHLFLVGESNNSVSVFWDFDKTPETNVYQYKTTGWHGVNIMFNGSQVRAESADGGMIARLATYIDNNQEIEVSA